MIALKNQNNEIYYILESEKSYYKDREATQEEIDEYKSNLDLEHLRNLRQECFEIVNRGVLWFNDLSEQQKEELNLWYHQWLDVPQVYTISRPININDIIPHKPEWLK